ncbi:hypothetical protein H0H92_001618 [Tricholoma furcatifolium]|nr:hypothetical protein H0H92_001618 [Tricholoma furcatifolium]
MSSPDKRENMEIVLESSKSTMSQERNDLYKFNFDQVSEPRSTHVEVFEGISEVAHSQTGSGKLLAMVVDLPRKLRTYFDFCLQITDETLAEQHHD